MKKILVPTDFSDCAEVASNAAIQIAKKYKVEIEFLHSASSTIDWKKLSPKDENKYPETKHRIGHAKAELEKLERKADKAGVKSNTHLGYNLDANGIVKHGKKFGCDMIVMGTHGCSGVKEVFVGSLTQKITRVSKLPVLAIKSKPANYNFKSIVFSSDFKKESKTSFKFINEFSQKLNSKIDLLYVNTPGTFELSIHSKKNMGEFSKKYSSNVTAMHIENSTRESDGILEYANEHKPDLIAIATHNRHGLNHLIAGSISESILNHSNVPVLLIPV